MIADYFQGIEKLLHSCPLTVTINAQIEIIDISSGYFKAVVEFVDGSELHLFEFVTAEGDKFAVEKYRYHYQDFKGNLVKRWDNARHHPEIKTFPDHLHDGDKIKGSGRPGTEDVLLEIVNIIEAK